MKKKKKNIELRQWYYSDNEEFCQLVEQADLRLTDGFFPSKLKPGEEYSWIKFMVDFLIYERELHYAIVCNGQVVGCVNVSRMSKAYINTGELRIVLLPDFCGQGVATESVRLVVEKAFELCRVSKRKKAPRFETLVAYVVGNNPAAEKVLLANGFHYVGTQRLSAYKEGEVYDQRVFNLARLTSVSKTNEALHVSLKPWTENDADLYLNMIHKVDFAYQDETLRPKNREEATEFLSRMLMQAKHTNSIYSAVLMGNEVIGHVQVMRMQSHQVGLVGCLIVKKMTGKGVGTEAVRIASNYALKHKGFERLEAWVYGPNNASSRILEKVGFKHEATLHRSVQKKGIYYDSLLYGMLREEHSSS